MSNNSLLKEGALVYSSDGLVYATIFSDITCNFLLTKGGSIFVKVKICFSQFMNLSCVCPEKNTPVIVIKGLNFAVMLFILCFVALVLRYMT